MNILVSACLLGVECRYDGKGVLDPAVKALLDRHFLIPVSYTHLGTVSYCDVELEGGFHVSGILLLDRMTPGILEMFEGLPLEEIL